MGETEDGVASEPSEATVTVLAPSDSADNNNANDNVNDSSGDDGTDNANDNDGRPSRGGRG